MLQESKFLGEYEATKPIGALKGSVLKGLTPGRRSTLLRGDFFHFSS